MADLVLYNVAYRDCGPFNLRVAAKTIACMTGPSGSGKSLLLRALADLDPHEGRIALGDFVQHRTEPQVWRKRVGFMPAEIQWWFETVGPHFGECREELLAGLGFTKKVMDKEVHHLSSGEKQRLGLARLLNNGPAALLLDEPTANLDKENTARVEQMVSTLVQREGWPVLWVSHDLEQIERVADQALNFTKQGLENWKGP